MPRTKTRSNAEKSPLEALRLEQLKKVSRLLGRANSTASYLRNKDDPNIISPATRNRYNTRNMPQRAEAAREAASRELIVACGACALRDQCTMSGDFTAWTNSHPYASNPRGKNVITEDREHLLARLNRSPDAPCDPAKIVPSEEDQMMLDFQDEETIKIRRRTPAGPYDS